MLGPKRNFKKGFTLVELLVTISIFVILTGIVMFNQSKFNSTILLTNLAYDTAITVRQAQTYGINIKEFGVGQFVPYGVHLETGVNSKSFILFADLNSVGMFNGVTLTACVTSEGCVNRYNIQRGNYIKDICSEELATGVYDCSSDATRLKRVDIVFKRPNPDALIRTVDLSDQVSENVNSTTVILSSPDGNNTRKIEVQANGLIQIVN